MIALAQPFINRKLVKKSFIIRLLTETFINLLLFFDAILTWIFYWRAIPYLVQVSSNELSDYLLYHFGSFVLAVILRISCMIVGPASNFKDGDVSPEKTVFFEIKYLSIFFKVNL